MGKRLETTPRSRVRAALRQLWLISRERAKACKIQNNTCRKCGKKKSVAKGKEVKIEVHHLDGIDWNGIIDMVIERILPDPSRLEVLCVDCHKKETKGEKNYDEL
jgi:5-methylcytosine-specific restriction endonuclease McrA